MGSRSLHRQIMSRMDIIRFNSMNSHDIKEEKANIYIYIYKITMTLVIHSRTNLYIFKGSNNVEYET